MDPFSDSKQAKAEAPPSKSLNWIGVTQQALGASQPLGLLTKTASWRPYRLCQLVPSLCSLCLRECTPNLGLGTILPNPDYVPGP